MKKSNKILLLILTLLPLVLIVPMFASMFRFICKAEQWEHSHIEPSVHEVLFGMGGFMIWVILIAIISLGLLVYYIVHAVKNQSISDTEKLIWILLFLFLTGISHLIYFFVRIWDVPDPEST